MKPFAEGLLWLFVINRGIAFGAGLYEKRIVLPLSFSRAAGTGWQVNSGAMRQTDVGLRFWAYATTVPLTLLAIANLVMALLSKGASHDWWLVAATPCLVERVGTVAFFIPTAGRLMKAQGLPAGVASALAARWIHLNYARDALTLFAGGVGGASIRSITSRVFVPTNYARAPLVMEGGTTLHFVTEGIASALAQAREAAEGKDVRVGGGVNVIQQYLRQRMIDEMDLAIAPVLLGSGERLFDGSTFLLRAPPASSIKALHLPPT